MLVSAIPVNQDKVGPFVLRELDPTIKVRGLLKLASLAKLKQYVEAQSKEALHRGL